MACGPSEVTTVLCNKHIESLIKRAKSKIGVLFARTPVNEVDLDLAMKLFQCYVQPIFEFNMIIWTTNYAESMDDKINVVLMGFLKRYCHIHPKTRNALVYHLTETRPLSQTLQEKALSQKDQLEQLREAFGLNVDKLLLVKERKDLQEQDHV